MPMPKVPATTALALRRAYRLMRSQNGHQHWWPGETPFEVCVGAILTQNTSWTNVERAMANLKAAGPLTPGALYTMSRPQLRQCLRPAGYFNLKTERLGAFLKVLVKEHGGRLDQLFVGETAVVRERLLRIYGIGPETADSMLLYAGGHARFVVDAYTRRIFERHGWCDPAIEYDDLQVLCETALSCRPADRQLDYWQDYHAQLVMVGKVYCRRREARCERCPLRPLLPAGGPKP
jgi:endonuclease-3 related protein